MAALAEVDQKRPCLTLKNIYRLMGQRDYPLYSYPALSREALSGLSLLKFWYGFFQSAFPASVDLTLFQSEQRQSRTLSRLLNRTGSARLMDAWFLHVSSLLEEELLLQFTETWMQTLERYHYDAETLTLRLNRFIRMTEAQEEPDMADLPAFLARLAGETLQESSAMDIPEIFRHAYLLSWLTLCALYGTRPRDASLNRLRLDTSLRSVYRLKVQNQLQTQPRLLSNRECTLCVQPLPPEQYFGRREETREALRILRENGKLAVTGIGGIGKTEFTRQFLRALLNSGIYDRVAYVQYFESLEASFASAFPQLQPVTENRVPWVRRLLEEGGAGKCLLAMDNVEMIPAQDPALEELCEYGCDILLTSRLSGPAGFGVLRLDGLNPADSRSLFITHDAAAAGHPQEVESICSFIQGHPLAIRLFASLCRVRFWPVERLSASLQERGLKDLSFIHQASSVRLEDVFQQTFPESSLTADQVTLLRLMALLPYRYWLPLELAPFARDAARDEDALADLCQQLTDLGWLLRAETGYAIHPLVAETMLLRPASAEEFPGLWAYMKDTALEQRLLHQLALISLIQRTARLNEAAIDCLSVMEQRIGFLSYQALPEKIYEIHRAWLDSREPSPQRERDYYLALGIRDIVRESRRDRIPEYLRRINPTSNLPADPLRKQSLYTLLEYASTGGEHALAESLFQALQPEERGSLDAADYLISYSVCQRRGLKDLAGAMASLREAREILDRYPTEINSLRRSNLCYRNALCLLDLGQNEEARQELEASLTILQETGSPEDSSEIMATRSTYAVTLSFCGKYPEAIQEYLHLTEQYRNQGRTLNGEYVMMRNNLAVVYAQAEQWTLARDVMTEVLRIDQRLGLPEDLQATHQRNAAWVLSMDGSAREAKPLAEHALAVRERVYGPDSPWTADARSIYALALCRLRDPAALPLIQQAHEALERQWGPEHRFTRTAARTLAEAKAAFDQPL